MQYLWANRMQLRPDMTDVDSNPIEIIDPGRLNADSGPDFFNAKIRMGGRVWAGNVEIHLRASDWHRHGHDDDPAYRSVILHVVGVSDTRITTPDGRTIPQLLLPAEPSAVEALGRLKASSVIGLPCAPALEGVPSLYLTDWISSLAFERLYDKADRIASLRVALGGDWESTAYVTLARALGFNTNSDPMERLARATPLNIIRKHSDDPLLIEALLLGQGGLIPAAAAPGSYAARIAREYSFLATKFSLSPPAIQWKMARMRPQNFPHRRIALLARLLCPGGAILSRILSISTFDEANAMFNRPLEGFWASAYTFAPAPEAEARVAGATLGRQSVMSLIINVVIPLKIAWGQAHGIDRYVDEAIDTLHAIPAEDNRLTRLFAGTPIANDSAFASQALIHLRRAYCERSECLRCRLSRHALRRS